MISYRHPPARRAVVVADVVTNGPICHEHHVLTLRMDWLPPSRPGQFVQLQCRELSPQRGYREVDWPADGPPRLSQPELAGKEPLRHMEFTSVGKSIAGAVGSLRSRDRVDFAPAEGGGTEVRLTSEVAVGGMLGALGHKVIASKSREMTAKFAAALRGQLEQGDRA